MKILLSVLSILSIPIIALAAILDPISDFKQGLVIAKGDKLLKWESELNGDGRNEIFVCLKSDHEKDKQNQDPPAWALYISQSMSATGFMKSTGIEHKTGVLSVDDMPLIDLTVCFVGQISELGRRGVITMRINSPREGESTGIIYAYVVDGNKLRKSELARYEIAKGPHALFTKYLAEGKRTFIQTTEINP